MVACASSVVDCEISTVPHLKKVPFLKPSMIDEETKQIIIKKTWCHGQLLAPVMGILCACWALSGRASSVSSIAMLLYASIILPLWSVVSYRAISSQPSHATLTRWGLLVELAHLGIFVLASKNLHETWSLLMFISSGLFFVETLAFLAVVTAFRSSLGPAVTSTQTGSPYSDFVDQPNANVIA